MIITFNSFYHEINSKIPEYSNHTPYWVNLLAIYFLDENVKPYSYQILSLNGKVIKSGQGYLPVTAISTKELAGGTYVIRIKNEDQNLGAFRFIKESGN